MVCLGGDGVQNGTEVSRGSQAREPLRTAVVVDLGRCVFVRPRELHSTRLEPQWVQMEKMVEGQGPHEECRRSLATNVWSVRG